VKANTSATLSVFASGSGSPVWETEPVVIRLH
jgi:hypothetical protein